MSLVDTIDAGARAVALLRRLIKPAERMAALHEAQRLLHSIDQRNKAKQETEAGKLERRHRRLKLGRDNSGLFEIAPAHDHENGVAHSSKGVILIRKGQTWLVWRYGGYFWSGRARHYAPPELEIRFPPSRQHRMPGKITDHFGGRAKRLSKALMLRHVDQIDSVFGAGATAKAAKLKGTVVLIPGREHARPA